MKKMEMRKKLINFLFFLIGKKREEKVDQDFRPKVSVLIPAYNEEKTIADTITSLQKQTYPIEEIIVVNDCSNDRTAEIAQGFAGVKVVTTTENTGTKARAQNFGLQFVKTEIVITLDADTILDEKAVTKIIPALADGKTLVASGFVIPQKIVSFWEKARLVQYLYQIGLNKKAQDHWQSPIVASGCFSAFKMSFLFELGGLPSDSIAEDMALTWKGLLNGLRVKFIPQSICYPKDPENWKQYKGQMTRWYRGFWQCFLMFKWKLLKNPKLSFFIAWYTISGIFSPFIILAVTIFLLVSYLTGNISSPWLLIFLVLLTETIIVLGVVLLEGLRHHKLRLAISGLVPFLAIMPLEAYLWVSAFVQECILGKKLDKWEKGH